MSNSNVIDLRKVFEKKPPPGEPRKCFASTRETLELLREFSRIEIGARGHFRWQRAAKEFGVCSARKSVRLSCGH